MAFKVFAVGEVLTAANVNDYLMEQAVIACTSGTRPSSPNEGMLIYETDTDRFVVYDGANWIDTSRAHRPPAVHIIRQTNQSVNSGGSGSAIQFASTEVETISTMWDSGTNTDVVIPVAGCYAITGWLQFAAAAGGVRAAGLLKNASNTNMPEQKIGAGGSGVDNVIVSTELPLAASDTIRLNAFHTQGSALNVANARLTVRYVGQT